MRDREKNFVSAVVYVHNCRERIGDFLEMLMVTLGERFDRSEIICVNDGSCDDSVSVIRETGQGRKETAVSILNLSSFHGVERAMAAGTDLAIGDFVLEFDSTIQDFSSSEIMEVYRKSLEGFDIVSALPEAKERFSSRLFYFFMDHFSDTPCSFHTERFRILSRRAVNRMGSMNKSVVYRKAAYANCGLKTAAITYLGEKIREYGEQDRKERKYRIDLAVDALILFTNVGYRFSVMMTVIMMLFAAAMAVYCVWIYMTSSPIEGWTTTIMFLSAAFFGLFGILTIMIRYLQIVVNLIFKKKQYSFESIEKLT